MKITKAQLKQIIKEELGKVMEIGTHKPGPGHEEIKRRMFGSGLQQQLAALNAEADAAFKAGARKTYDALVVQMIELENAHLDAGGELPLPRHTDDTQAIGE